MHYTAGQLGLASVPDHPAVLTDQHGGPERGQESFRAAVGGFGANYYQQPNGLWHVVYRIGHAEMAYRWARFHTQETARLACIRYCESGGRAPDEIG